MRKTNTFNNTAIISAFYAKTLRSRVLANINFTAKSIFFNNSRFSDSPFLTRLDNDNGPRKVFFGVKYINFHQSIKQSIWSLTGSDSPKSSVNRIA